MSDFADKAIFIWEHSAIENGDATRISTRVFEAGFEAAFLHSAYLSSWKSPSRILLAQKLQRAGVQVYASCGVYGTAPTADGAMAGSIVEEFGLAGFVFDAEATFDSRPNAAGNAIAMLKAYQAATAKPSAWCWWPLYESSSGTATYHPKAILGAAMQHADVGMPMAYWSWGDSALQAVAYLDEVWQQWRAVTDKPLAPAGRAFVGAGGTPNPAAVAAWDARARDLGAVGASWWSMQHALALPGIWQALADTAPFDSSDNPDIPGGNMWENNALIAAFDGVGDNPAPAQIDFSALKAGGIDAVLINLGTCTDALNYDEPYAGAVDNPDRVQRLRAARAAGLVALGEYSYSPVLNSVNGYNGRWTLQHINYVTSGEGKPDGGLILTCERYQWTESGNSKDCVPTMYIQDLRAVQGALWDAHKLVGGIRTGRWFLDRSKAAFDVLLDPLNADQDRCPLFAAYWWKSRIQVSGSFREVIADVPDPVVTTVQVNSRPVNLQAYFLYIGDNTRWRGWECATVYHPAVLDAAGKPALFRLIIWRGDPADLRSYFNLPPAGADTTPPSTPSGLQVTVVGDAMTLAWQPATDNVGVVGYRLYRNDDLHHSTTTTTATLTGQAPGAYTYSVSAFDAAGNESPRSSEVAVTIPSPTPPEDAQVLELLREIRAGMAAVQARLDQIFK